MYQGSCACGAFRFRLKDRPMFINACHCRDCQTQTGGPFVVNGLIESALIEGDESALERVEMPSPSGRGHDIYRCRQCLTAVWSDYGHRPALRFIRMMTLEDRNDFPADAHIFVRSKLPWVTIPDGQKAYDIFYDLASTWPPESLRRRDAILPRP